jgi:two-component system chemotaxis response regulator CheY
MDSASRTVIIVDDELFFRELLRDILTDAGFTVVAEAEDGSEAVEKYRALRPAVILMDIFMPGTSGIDATKEIMSFDDNARVLICSGVGYDENVEAALNAGAREVIFKPFIPEEVTQAITKALA